MGFNDRQTLVLHCMVMRLSEKDSLKYMKAHGYDISRDTLYEEKKNIKGAANQRRFELIKEGLFEQHLERIDQLETVLKLSWENYHAERRPFHRQKILDSIMTIQPLLSTYYHATQRVIEEDARKGILHDGYLSVQQ